MLKQISHLIFISLLSTMLFACGGGGGGGGNNNGEINEGPETPVAIVNPENLSFIKGNVSVVIYFDQTMDTDILFADGGMSIYGGVWSTTENENDTLTFSPQTRWGEGVNKLDINVQNTSGDELGLMSLSYTVDDTAPTSNPVPSDGSQIQNNLSVKIVFSESIDKSTLIVSKSIWDESGTAAWSAGDKVDDTLTLSPSTFWSEGIKNLSVQARDLAGNLLETQNYTYIIDTISPSIDSVSPMNEGQLTQTMPVIIKFSETIDVSSVIAAGLLKDEGGFSYSTTTILNDTLTIQPTGVWSLASHTLQLDLGDIYGNALQTLNLTYSVGCPASQTNCGGQCVDLTTDINNCGQCNLSCDGKPNVAQSVCASGSCSVSSCNNDYSDCNSNHGDGCEVNIASNRNNCGGCNIACNDSVSCATNSCENRSCKVTENNSSCTTYESWGICIWPSICAYTGTRTRTVIPGTCSQTTGCASDGTPYLQERTCYRYTDSTSCGTGSICINERCENIAF